MSFGRSPPAGCACEGAASRAVLGACPIYSSLCRRPASMETVEAVVRTRRLPAALRMCGIGPRRAAAPYTGTGARRCAARCGAFGLGRRVRDDLAVGDIVIADRALSAGRSDVKCLALPLPGTGTRSPRPNSHRRPRHRCSVSEAAATATGRWPWRWKPTGWPTWAVQHDTPFVHGRGIHDGGSRRGRPPDGGVHDGYSPCKSGPVGSARRRPSMMGEFTRWRSAFWLNRRLAELAEAAA